METLWRIVNAVRGVCGAVWEWVYEDHGDWRDLVGLAALVGAAVLAVALFTWAYGVSGGYGSRTAHAASTEQCCKGRCERCANMAQVLRQMYRNTGVRA